jgi:uncharacterized protein YndB with AHSA1/START domain
MIETADAAETGGASANEIVFECDLPHAPAKVWRALSEPHLRAAWLGDAEAGECEVVDARPPERLDLIWRAEDGASHVRFEIAEGTDGGAHLTIVHRLAEPAAELLAMPAAGPLMCAANDNAPMLQAAA